MLRYAPNTCSRPLTFSSVSTSGCGPDSCSSPGALTSTRTRRFADAAAVDSRSISSPLELADRDQAAAATGVDDAQVIHDVALEVVANMA
jgi:hypothetical protein